MKMIFSIIISLSHASSFDPDILSKDLQKHLLSQLSHGGTHSKYREIDFLFKTQKILNTSCQIELRDEQPPKSCFRLLKMWEKQTQRQSARLHKNIQEKALLFTKKSSVEEYIARRKNQKSGIKNE